MNTKLLEYEQSIANDVFIFPYNDSSVRIAEAVEHYSENKTAREHSPISVSRTLERIKYLNCRDLNLSKLASKKLWERTNLEAWYEDTVRKNTSPFRNLTGSMHLVKIPFVRSA